MLNRFNKTSLNKRSPLVRGSSLFGKVNGAIALGLMLLVLPGCDATDRTTTTTTTTTPGTGTTTTPGMETTGMIADFEEVADNPNQFMGQTVTLSGEVAEVLGPNVFRLQEDQLIGGNDIIVITTDAQTPVMEDSQVQVTGEVRQLVITEIERDYDLGWDDTLRTEIEREYTDRSAIVAQSIQPMMTNP
ncbi:hypothetical protein J0895_22560 [Phormidium pseudopriestleyi FRX01]|uniref:DUF5666 domain-containing protein n=1 Tax=Phormidium pseudopriestleyi FRX01 TaxID=1759528 RepID=A0ABS3FYA3_9CYAN|nr:hypothetical protein [Phormidium pseudopriestleyi]MBO0351812.1 hypothetical protein [Phormidium pseudopriestleyi FRX01]